MFLTAFNSLTGVLVFIGILFFILILYGFAGEYIGKSQINKISDPGKREYVRNYYKKYGDTPSHPYDEGGQVLLLTIIALILVIGVSVVFFTVL